MVRETHDEENSPSQELRKKIELIGFIFHFYKYSGFIKTQNKSESTKTYFAIFKRTKYLV